MLKTIMRLSLPVMALLLLGPMTSSAGAQIVVGQGASNVRLGDTESQVRQILGKPFRELNGDLFYARPCLCTLDFRHGLVQSIDTLSKNQRTNKGIGPGSSFAETTAAYPEAKCRHTGLYGPTSQVCVLSEHSEGRTVKTAFSFFEKSLPLRDVEIWAP